MRFLTTVLLGIVASLAVVAAVSGHAAPERFDPAPGAVLSEAPAQIEGWFTQEIRRQEGASFIQVFNVAGDQVDSGEPVVDDEDRRHMYVGLQPGLGEGRYMVAWQGLSDEDDEFDGGCHWFFVGQAAADAAHEEKLRINAPEGCQIDLEDASVIFGQAEGGVEDSITIDMPEVVQGSEVTVLLSTENTTIRPPTGTGRDPNFAHFHLYLDQVPSLEHSHDEEGGEGQGNDMDMDEGEEAADFSRDIMVIGNEYTLKDLTPGNHVLSAALFYDDHSPFQPTVVESLTFTVAGGGDGDGGDVSVGTLIGAAVGAGAAMLVVGAAGGWAVARRRS
jgi:methionine-rich copper-binding protein CopC